jgi:hypothetical protein
MNDQTVVPEDFAPVVRNLSNLLSTRKVTIAKLRPVSRPRRNTLGGPSTSTPTDSGAAFPLGKRYPFTFKMMLHKLYDLEEWAKKVKDVVEMSQKQFKPLAERECEERQREGEGYRGTGKGKRVALTRARSHSVMGTRRTKEGAGPPSPIMRQTRENEFRALKKRCIGRRKSVAGSMRDATGVVRGEWIYDAAVSSIEQMLDTTTHNHAARPRHRSLTGLERIAARDTAYQQLKIKSSRRVPTVAESEQDFDWDWGIPEDGIVDGADKTVAKRRAMSLAESFDADGARRLKFKDEACFGSVTGCPWYVDASR